MGVAFFCDFTNGYEYEEDFIEKIKTASNNLPASARDSYIAISRVGFDSKGFPINKEIEERKAIAWNLGIDKILWMPEYSCLSDIDIFSYSTAILLDDSNQVDYLALETQGLDIKLAIEIAFILIKNERTFTKRVTYYKHSRLPFSKALAKAMDEVIPGTEQIMLNEKNLLAISCVKYLKLRYSSIKCICVDTNNEIYSKNPVKEVGPQVIESVWSEKLHERIYAADDEILDTYGGHSIIFDAIVENRNQYQDFEQFARDICGEDDDIEDIRRFLVRLCLGISKNSIIGWRLKDFSEGASWEENELRSS